MLRSFHYGISSALLQRVASLPEDAPLLQAWADGWYSYVAGSFLRAYVRTVAPARLVPAEAGAFENLLQAFLLEKAVYEVGYEMNKPPPIGSPSRCEVSFTCSARRRSITAS